MSVVQFVVCLALAFGTYHPLVSDMFYCSGAVCLLWSVRVIGIVCCGLAVMSWSIRRQIARQEVVVANRLTGGNVARLRRMLTGQA